MLWITFLIFIVSTNYILAYATYAVDKQWHASTSTLFNLIIYKGIVTVSCNDNDDILCYHKKLEACGLGITDLCSPTKGIVSCIRDSTLNCLMANDKDAKPFLNFTSCELVMTGQHLYVACGICKYGLPTNEEHIAYWPCTSKTNETFGYEADFEKVIVRLRRMISSDVEIIRKSSKLGCDRRFKGSVTACTLSKVMNACGIDAESIREEEQNSEISQQRNKLYCYVSSVSPIFLNLPIWVLQAVILAFTFG